jgi:hypothetical protein
VGVEELRSVGPVRIGEVPPASDPRPHRVRRRSPEVMNPAIVGLRDRLGVVLTCAATKPLSTAQFATATKPLSTAQFATACCAAASSVVGVLWTIGPTIGFAIPSSSHPTVVTDIVEFADGGRQELLLRLLAPVRTTPALGVCRSAGVRHEIPEPLRSDVLPGDLPVRGPTETTSVRQPSKVRDSSRWILAVAPPCGCRAP